MSGPESKIQDAVVRWARETYKGKLIARKFQAGTYGTNGWPDYEFLLPGAVVCHVEFKRPGGECTALQLARHAELRALGHRVYVVTDALAGKQIIRNEMEGNVKAARKLRGSMA